MTYLHPSTGDDQPEEAGRSDVPPVDDLVRKALYVVADTRIIDLMGCLKMSTTEATQFREQCWDLHGTGLFRHSPTAVRWERLARIEHAASGRWQEMAEDLWEELQEWHDDECSHGRPTAPLSECTCHRILAVKWDEITNAADWANDGDES